MQEAKGGERNKHGGSRLIVRQADADQRRPSIWTAWSTSSCARAWSPSQAQGHCPRAVDERRVGFLNHLIIIGDGFVMLAQRFLQLPALVGSVDVAPI